MKEKIKRMINNLIDKNHAEFRKDYLEVMNTKYKKNSEIVKDYVYKRISLGKPTYI